MGKKQPAIRSKVSAATYANVFIKFIKWHHYEDRLRTEITTVWQPPKSVRYREFANNVFCTRICFPLRYTSPIFVYDVTFLREYSKR